VRKPQTLGELRRCRYGPDRYAGRSVRQEMRENALRAPVS
jgi:hypothetical protein